MHVLMCPHITLLTERFLTNIRGIWPLLTMSRFKVSHSMLEKKREYHKKFSYENK
jgi:hypothetical protein